MLHLVDLLQLFKRRNCLTHSRYELARFIHARLTRKNLLTANSQTFYSTEIIEALLLSLGVTRSQLLREVGPTTDIDLSRST